jgi:hypothetical protein
MRLLTLHENIMGTSAESSPVILSQPACKMRVLVPRNFPAACAGPRSAITITSRALIWFAKRRKRLGARIAAVGIMVCKFNQLLAWH